MNTLKVVWYTIVVYGMIVLLEMLEFHLMFM